MKQTYKWLTYQPVSLSEGQSIIVCKKSVGADVGERLDKHDDCSKMLTKALPVQLWVPFFPLPAYTNYSDEAGSDKIFRSVKVLVVEDEPIMRMAIGYILKSLKVDFDLVSSGEEGLRELDKHPNSYRIVLLDLILHTGDNGVEIFRRMQHKYRDLLVILMTASGSKESIFEDAAELGCPILRKPFSPDDIVDIIDNFQRDDT